MPITITKQKETAQKQAPQLDVVDVTALDIDELADRYGELEDRTQALLHNPAFAQFEAVRKELNARLEDLSPEDEAEIKGKHWMLEISMAKKKARQLKSDAVDKLIAFLGIQTFSAIAKVNISDVEKYCTPDQVAQVIDEDTGYTKNRSVTATYLG